MPIDRQMLLEELAQGMRFLHGTTEDFDEFDLERAQGGPWGRGFYFSNDITLAREYSEGGSAVEATIVLKTPYLIDRDISYDHSCERQRVFRPSMTARERLMEMGYDGIVLVEGGYVEVVAYDSASLFDLARVPTVDPPNPRPSTLPTPRP